MQRRLFSLGFLGSCTVLFLVSCRAALPRQVPAEEALRRTVVRNALLDSVAFDATIALRTASLSGSLALTGSSLRGGSAVSAAGTVSLAKEAADGAWMTLHGPIRFVTNDNGQLAFQGKNLQGTLAESLNRSFVGGVDDRWWLLTSGSGSRQATVQSSPDASEINALLGAVRVISGSDILRAEDGEFEYQIAVGLSTGSTLVQGVGQTQLHGQLWIDARSFVLRRVRWDVANAASPDGPADVLLDVRFSKFDKAPHPKTNAASVQTIPAKSLLDTILRKPLVP